MNKHMEVEKNGRLGYILWKPEGSETNLPLIIYLHGAGERGTNLEHLYRHGLCRQMEEGLELPAAVLCPQCPVDCVWDNITHRVKALIDEIAEALHCDMSRITITGSSMGGFGTWAMGLNYSTFFAAIAPVAGGGMSWRCTNLVKMPVYALHGRDDTLVPPVMSELMVNAVNAAGGSAQLKLLDGLGHNDGIWHAYSECGVAMWLISQKRTDFEPVPEFCSEWF